jgi:hypothetical protein
MAQSKSETAMRLRESPDCLLFNLPAELRCRIYELVWENKDVAIDVAEGFPAVEIKDEELPGPLSDRSSHAEPCSSLRAAQCAKRSQQKTPI